jgi:hypothetical protein
MRKLALIFLASVALLGSACGGGGSDNKDDASGVNADAKVGVNRAAATAAAAKVCDSREAITFAGAAAGAAQNSAGKDLKSYSQALKDAASSAPSEIKADFTLIADTYGAYIDLIASANGNYMALAKNPEFQAKVQKLQEADVKSASDHITAYFAEHCKG